MSAGHSPKMPPNILNLPFEVLHGILVLVEPEDLARLCCCRPLYKYIKGNRLLFKQVYLTYFVSTIPVIVFKLLLRSQSQDNPSHDSDYDFSWEQELPKLVRFQKVLQSSDIELRVRRLLLFSAQFIKPTLEIEHGHCTILNRASASICF